jgi:hypothetical protein
VFKKKDDTALISVPYRVHKRAKRALRMGDPTTWIDQTLYLIGHNMTHHKHGDPMLEEAVTAAQALLAMLEEMRRAEAL